MAYIVTSPDLGQRLTSLPPRQRLLPLMGRELELASEPDTACLSSLTSADAMTMMPRNTVTLHEEGRVGRSSSRSLAMLAAIRLACAGTVSAALPFFNTETARVSGDSFATNLEFSTCMTIR
jgi:hypothetical protein